MISSPSEIISFLPCSCLAPNSLLRFLNFSDSSHITKEMKQNAIIKRRGDITLEKNQKNF